MSQKPIHRTKPLAQSTKRRNIPSQPKIKNAVVRKFATEVKASTIKKIENTVASRAGQEPGGFNLVKLDKQLLGRLAQVQKSKKK